MGYAAQVACSVNRYKLQEIPRTRRLRSLTSTAWLKAGSSSNKVDTSDTQFQRHGIEYLERNINATAGVEERAKKRAMQTRCARRSAANINQNLREVNADVLDGVAARCKAWLRRAIKSFTAVKQATNSFRDEELMQIIMQEGLENIVASHRVASRLNMVDIYNLANISYVTKTGKKTL